MLLSAFLLGFAGSLHCIGMCGPIALMIHGKSDLALLRNRIVYNLGRTITYVMMGLAVGVFGKIFQWGGLQGMISITLGFLIILILIFPKIQAYFLPSISGVTLKLKDTFRRHLRSQHLLSAGITGMLNGLLPCGLVYAALAIALVQPTPTESATIMLLFGLGTVPMLLSAAYSWHALKAWIPFVSSKLQTTMLVIVAVVMIWRGFSVETGIVNGSQVTECNPQSYYSEVED